MNAGELRTRVQVQQATETTAAEGQIDRTWETIGSRWARVRPVSGREFWQAQMVQSDITHVVRMRYDPGITRRNRLLLGQYESGRKLNIAAVFNLDERRKEIELPCVEDTT